MLVTQAESESQTLYIKQLGQEPFEKQLRNSCNQNLCKITLNRTSSCLENFEKQLYRKFFQNPIQYSLRKVQTFYITGHSFNNCAFKTHFNLYEVAYNLNELLSIYFTLTKKIAIAVKNMVTASVISFQYIEGDEL